MIAASAPAFTRDRLTWLAYAMLGYYAYLQAVLGPAMPLLRSDLRLSYTVGGMHFSALALGMVMAGLWGDHAIERWGRRAVFWGGGGGMAGGALLVIGGRHAAITIAGAWIMGLLGTALQTALLSSLADRHGARRVIALTEANVVASGCTILPPLLTGGFERAGIGWRAALVVPLVLWAAAFVTQRGESIPPARPRLAAQARSGGALPAAFWAFWVALGLCVAVEWSIAAWGADFLVAAGGLRKADASIVMTLFFLAMMTGRALGSRMARQMKLDRLLLAAMGIGLAGFMAFWLGPLTPVVVAGLFVAGLGVANLYPFLLSITVNTIPDRPDLVSSRVGLGAGLAILIAPQLLGSLADRTGIQAAYGLVFGLFALAAGVVTAARRLQARAG